MSKKNIVWIIAIILVIAACFIGGMLLRKPKKEDKKKEPEQKEFTYMPATFKICDEDSCVHITGSYHIGDERIAKLDKKIIDIYENADYLALEVPELSADISSLLLKDGKTIKDLVPEEFYTKLENFSKEHPMYALGAYQYYNLGYQSTVLSLLPFMEKKAMTFGIDSQFLNRAKEDNKEILAFETMEFQMNLLTGYSDEFYIKSIEAIIDNYDEIAKLQFDIYEAYLKGDVDEMNKLLAAEEEAEDNGEEPTEEQIEYTNAMFANRNDNMVEGIKGYLKDNKNVFIVVGEAHVIPEGAILDQLKEANYKVTRVE